MTKSYRQDIHGKAPYFDDYDEDKKFLRVLFRPGFPLQARELTQLQTIVQNQIEQVGSHLFDDGASVRGGEISEANGFAVRLSGTTFTTQQLDSFLNKTITNASGTVSANIVSYADKSTLADDNNQIFFINYTTTGSFTGGDQLTIESTLPVTTVTVGSQGDAPAVSTATNIVCADSGVFYADGFLVKTAAQSFAAFNETATYRDFNNPTSSVGFKIEREVVTSDDDESLNDPSFGYFNFNSPGADRYKVNLKMTQVSISGDTGVTFDSENYLELVRVINGETTKTIRFTDYAIFEENLARRTFDESGNYTVRPFSVNPVEYDSVFSGTDTDKHAIRIEPGKAYVNGFEYETIAPSFIPVDRALTTNSLYNERLSTPLGSYVKINKNQSRDNLADNFSTTFIQGRKARIVKDDGAGTVTEIGTCNIRSFERIPLDSGGVENRLYIFNIKIPTTSTLKFKDSTHIECLDSTTDSIEGGADLTAVFKIGDAGVPTTLYRPQGGRQIFRVPRGEGVLSMFSDGAYQSSFLVKKSYDVNFASGQRAHTETSKHDFLEGSERNYAFFYTDNTDTGLSGATLMNYGTDYTVTVDNSNENRTVTVDLSSSINASGRGTLIASQIYQTYIDGSNNVQGYRTKTISDGLAFGKTGPVSTGIIPLAHTDVLSITSLTDADGRDVTQEFELDRNETVDAYRISRVVLKPGSTCAVDANGNYNLSVSTYKRFSHSGDGPFIIDSYPISDEFGYSDIPMFTDPETGERYSLGDAVDFRPIADSVQEEQFTNGSGASPTTAFENGVIPSRVSYQHYLPRIDKVLLNSNRTFSIIKGVPSLEPVSPEVLPGDMDICDLVLTPFTSTPDDIRVRFIDNQRSTMKDIAEIEKVQQNDSFFVFRNDLEQLALNRAINFRSTRTALGDGIFVDSFIGHNNSLTSGRDHNCSIDPETNRMKPAFETNMITLTAATADIGSGSVRTSDGIITLESTADGFASNEKANTTITANQFSIGDYLGTCNLTPASDNYFSTSIKPKVIVNTVGEMDNWESDLNAFQRGRSRGFGAQWRDWESIWFGSTRRIDTEVEHDPSSKEYDLNRKSSYLKRVLSDKIIRKVGQKIVDLSVVPYVRNRRVTFNAKNMKPGSQVYAFFDNTAVGTTIGYEVDALGDVSGTFTIPNNTLLTGEKLFRLVDNSANTINLATTSADAVFYAQGLLETSSGDITSVRPPITRRKASNVDDVTDDRFESNQKNNLTRSYNSQTPFAQEIFVDASKYPNGIMLKDVSLLFQNRPPNGSAPIKVHIRPMFNGAPDPYKVLPFSEVTKQAEEVNVAIQGPNLSNKTTFEFSTPVYLQPRKSYAICVSTNDSRYNLWLGQEGEFALDNLGSPTAETVSKPTYFTALHKPSNNGQYNTVTDEYLHMDVNICSFASDESTVRFVSNRQTTKQYHVGFVPMNNQVAGGIEPTVSLKVKTYNPDTGADPTFTESTIFPNQTIEFNEKKVVSDIAVSAPADRSVQLNAILKKDTTGRVCSMIDEQRVDFLAVEYMANKSVSAADTEESAPNSRLATNRSRYVGRKVVLSERADDMAVFVEGSFVGESRIKVYVKVQGVDSPSGNFDDNNFIELYPEGNSDPDAFDQFKPIGESGGVMRFSTPLVDDSTPSDTGEYVAYQIKIVLMGSEGNIGPASSVPIINSLQVVPLRRSKLDETRRFVPIGTVLPFAGADIPDGFIKCDGSRYAIDADGLRDLFAVIGYTYGGTENVDFAVPDFRGRVAVGLGSSRGSGGGIQVGANEFAQSLGQRFGAAKRLLEVDNVPLPPHWHGFGFGVGGNDDALLIQKDYDQGTAITKLQQGFMLGHIRSEDLGEAQIHSVPGDTNNSNSQNLNPATGTQFYNENRAYLTTWPTRPHSSSNDHKWMGGYPTEAIGCITPGMFDTDANGFSTITDFSSTSDPAPSTAEELERVTMAQPSMTVNYIIKI